MKTMITTALFVLVIGFRQLHCSEVISLEPQNPKTLVSEDISFICTVTNDSDPSTVKWSMVPKGSESGMNLTTDMERVNISVENSTDKLSILTLSHLTPNDSGTYKCDLMSQNLSRSVTTELMVLEAPFVEITSNPTDTRITRGNSIKLTCNTNYKEKVKWSKDGQDLGSGNSKVDIDSNTLTIMESNFTDAGTYQCIVDITDDVGREDWIKALDSILFMNDVNVTISEDNIRREEGETIHITCSATSYPMPTIIWMKDHALMENTSAAERFVVTVVEDDKSNVVMSTLTLRAITFEDRGAYTCNATTSHNSGNKEYELRIIDRMAAVWPFLGIMCEVIGLIVIILAVERYQTGELVCK